MSYVLANWKMHTTPSEGVRWLGAAQAALEDRLGSDGDRPTAIVCPPFVSLTRMKAAVDERLVRLGAQNCHWEREGPHTGEVSPTMLAGLVDYVLVGHSERRAAGETDEQIAKKVAAAAAAGLTPILFVGEDEPSDRAAQHTERRLERGLAELDLESHRPLVVYEPTWAVGAERPADPEHVRGVVERLKARLGGLGVRTPEVIYGGTVSADTVERFAGIAALDGVGATRASLDPAEFLRIFDAVARASMP
jgi:triosephosphate isomerase (TIM)